MVGDIIKVAQARSNQAGAYLIRCSSESLLAGDHKIDDIVLGAPLMLRRDGCEGRDRLLN